MSKFYTIPNTNGLYEINEGSEIRRIKHRVKNNINGGTRSVGGKILSQKTKSNGYKEVALYIEPQKGVMRYVHRLMYQTFVGEIPSGYEINHINGDKSDNKITNLELVTPSQNRLHSWHVLGNKNLKAMKGENHPRAIVSEDFVRKAKDQYKNGISVRDIYDNCKEKITLSSLRKICYGQTWRHI